MFKVRDLETKLYSLFLTKNFTRRPMNGNPNSMALDTEVSKSVADSDVHVVTVQNDIIKIKVLHAIDTSKLQL
jgi:hypothetical protein